MANPYELRYDIYQQASQRLMDKFYQDHALWQDLILGNEREKQMVIQLPPLVLLEVDQNSLLTKPFFAKQKKFIVLFRKKIDLG